MKNLILLSIIALTLSSCATVPLNQRLTQRFIMETACTDAYTIQTIGEYRNLLNQYNGGSYLFTCGKEKYACKATYISSHYTYAYSCRLKMNNK